MVIGVLSTALFWQQPFLNPHSNGWFVQIR